VRHGSRRLHGLAAAIDDEDVDGSVNAYGAFLNGHIAKLLVGMSPFDSAGIRDWDKFAVSASHGHFVQFVLCFPEN
jgi:hypothetical protein